MSNAGKLLFSFFLILTMVTYCLFKSDVIVFDAKKEAYVSSIRAASQVATAEIMDVADVNFIYDGNKREPADISVNLGALDTFRETLTRLLDAKKDGSMTGVTNINVPLTGFITYRYVVGVGYAYDKNAEYNRGDEGNGKGYTYLLPAGYTYKMTDPVIPAEIRDKVWEFTLGDKVYIEDRTFIMSGTALTDTISKNDYDIKAFLQKSGFKEAREFAKYIVMDCIDTYLNEYSGASFNPIAENTQTKTEFNLGKSNYSSNREEYTEKSALIDGPGLFAIVDVYKGSGNEQRLYQRIASFGGSELVQVN